MSLNQGPTANLWQNQDSNSGLSWPQIWALSTPWKTLEKGWRPPRERDQHRIRVMRVPQALFPLPNTLTPVPLLLSYTATHTHCHQHTWNSPCRLCLWARSDCPWMCLPWLPKFSLFFASFRLLTRDLVRRELDLVRRERWLSSQCFLCGQVHSRLLHLEEKTMASPSLTSSDSMFAISHDQSSSHLTGKKSTEQGSLLTFLYIRHVCLIFNINPTFKSIPCTHWCCLSKRGLEVLVTPI